MVNGGGAAAASSRLSFIVASALILLSATLATSYRGNASSRAFSEAAAFGGGTSRTFQAHVLERNPGRHQLRRPLPHVHLVHVEHRVKARTDPLYPLVVEGFRGLVQVGELLTCSSGLDLVPSSSSPSKSAPS